MKDLEEQNIIKQYLLGQLGETESERLEEKVITDPEYEDTVSLVEDELIEDFVANELSGNEREHFVKHFLSTPQQLQRVRLAEAVYTYFIWSAAPPHPLTQTKPTVAPFWKRWAANLGGRGQYAVPARFTAVVLAMLLVGAAVFLASRYLREDPAEEQRAALQQKLTRLNDPRQSADELRKNFPTFQVVLTTDFGRSEEGMAKVSVPADAKVVQLELPAAQYESYWAFLRTIEGGEIFKLPLTAKIVDGNRELKINIPAELLSHSDYELNLTGLREDNKTSEARSYFFRIVR